MKQTGHFDTHVAGIPCQVRIVSYFRQRPLGPRADSDVGCYGYTECEYELLDRRGYRARWLERKINADTDARICELIDQYKEVQRDEY